MALNSAKTWVRIPSYNSQFVFSAQNTVRDRVFYRKAFIVRLSLTAHLRDISILLYGVLVKRTPRAYKTDISNINNVCFYIRQTYLISIMFFFFFFFFFFVCVCFFRI